MLTPQFTVARKIIARKAHSDQRFTSYPMSYSGSLAHHELLNFPGDGPGRGACWLPAKCESGS
jgi:hypothetical protein